MKNAKPMLWAAILSLALSISAFAGDIQSPGSPATCGSCKPSYEIQTSDATSSAESENPGTSGFAVDLLLAMLSFF